MNILLFVMSMLMLIAILTYGRLETFRNFAFVQSQFKTYMEVEEREYVNEEAVKRYNKTPATKREQSEQQKREQSPACSLLTFLLFVDKDERAANQDKVEPFILVTKNLIYYLYSNEKFFIEMEKKRPNFVDEILSRLIQVTEELPKEKKIKKVKELATINLQDAELNDAFTKMLKGTVDIKEKPKTQDWELEEGTTTQTEFPPHFKPEQGYYSLLEFITLKNKFAIRVYLASPQLLMAVFGNEGTVKQIQEARYRLYRSVINKQMTASQASQEFMQEFVNQRSPLIPDTLLNFEVSKTNPKHNPF